jgi:nicotinamidase-related amidase
MHGNLSVARLSTSDTALLVIDVQEKLLPKIDGAAALVRDIAFLIDCCRVLHVPAFVTEQYPKGLGSTIAELAKRLPADPPQKMAFSSCAVPTLTADFRADGRTKILVCGIEAHVCLMQTVLDLIAAEFIVFVAVDGIGSRYASDRQTAIRRMELAGAIPVTCEMAAFELTVMAGSPQFKEISRLVQQRMQAISADGANHE